MLGKPEAAEIARVARSVQRRSPCRDPRRARPLEDRLYPRRDQPRRFRRDLDDDRARSGQRAGAARPAMLNGTFERYWREFQARAARNARMEGLYALRDADDRQLRPPRLARSDRRADRLFHGGPPPCGVEPVGRSGRPRSARNPLHRRHAACLGGVGFRPRRARHVRLGTARRRRAGARRRAVGRVAGRRGIGDRGAGDALRQARLRDARGLRGGWSRRSMAALARPADMCSAWPFGGAPPAARIDGRPAAWRGECADIFRRRASRSESRSER